MSGTNYIINVYLSNYSNNFGYIDIIFWDDSGFYYLKTRNILGEELAWSKIYPGFVEKNLLLKNEVKQFKPNLNVLKDKKKIF